MRKLGLASVLIMPGMRVVKRAIVGAIRLGRMCRTSTRQVEHPVAIADCR